MSVFEKHEAFIKVLQKEVGQKKSKQQIYEVSVLDIQAELERKFDELFGTDEDDE